MYQYTLINRMKMDFKRWTFLLVFTCFSVVKEVAATLYCAYKTSTGVTQRTYCRHICCEGPDVTFDNVCCRYPHESTVNIGYGVAGILLISAVVYACLKRKSSKQGVSSGSNSSTNDRLPTVSFHVQPPQPPPYTSPPPYCPQEPGASVKVNEWFTIPKDPPPTYSLYDTSS